MHDLIIASSIQCTCTCYARWQNIDAKGDNTLGNMLHATQMITGKSSVNHPYREIAHTSVVILHFISN